VEETQWYSYVLRIAGDAKATEIADRAGFDKSALTRWKQGLSPDPLFVVRFARAYGRPVAEALVEAGVITSAEASITEIPVGSEQALQQASNDALIDELKARLASEAGEIGTRYIRLPGIVEIEQDGGHVGASAQTSQPQSDREVVELHSEGNVRRKASSPSKIAASDQGKK